MELEAQQPGHHGTGYRGIAAGDQPAPTVNAILPLLPPRRLHFCILSGHIGTDHPGARSFFWNRKGQFVTLPGPAKGAIAVQRHAPFDDLTWTTGKGHVGFVTSFTSTHVTLLGGNQSDTVKVQTYPLETRDAQGRLVSKFVAFMMPAIN